MDNVREKLMQQTAQDVKQPLDLVEKVISFQFKHAAQAVRLYGEVEFSGFGKIIISQQKLRRRIQTQERILGCLEQKLPLAPEKEQETITLKMDSIREQLAFYKTKLK